MKHDELIAQLVKQASDIANAGHNGWGNTMLLAADALRAQPAAPALENECELCASGYPVKHDANGKRWHIMGLDHQAECDAMPAPRPAGVALANALRILLKSRDCLTLDGRAEIPEELSAQFDIGLDDARQVVAALDAAATGDGETR